VFLHLIYLLLRKKNSEVNLILVKICSGKCTGNHACWSVSHPVWVSCLYVWMFGSAILVFCIVFVTVPHTGKVLVVRPWSALLLLEQVHHLSLMRYLEMLKSAEFRDDLDVVSTIHTPKGQFALCIRARWVGCNNLFHLLRFDVNLPQHNQLQVNDVYTKPILAHLSFVELGS